MSDMNPNPVAGAVQAEMGTGLPAAAYASPEQAQKARDAQQAASGQQPVSDTLANGFQIAAESTRRLAKGVGKMAILDDGTEVKIMRCKVNQYHLIAKILALVFQHLGIKTMGEAGQLDQLDPNRMIELLIELQDPVVEAVEALTDMEASQLEDLEMGDFVLLISDCWEVNKQFFLEKILPRLQRVMGKM